jgi:glyoxylase I family protein
VKLGHIALSVSNLERSAAFYGRHFGMRRGRKYDHRDKGFNIAFLQKGGITLELFEFKTYKPLPVYRRALDKDLKTLGVKHFSVEVADIEGVYKKLKRGKVVFATDLRVSSSGARYFFIKDPDGILVEIMEIL